MRMTVWMAALLLATTSAGYGAEEDSGRMAALNSYVQDWLVCGPFPNPEADGVDAPVARRGFAIDYLAAIGGEAGCRPSAGTEVTVDGTRYAFVPYHSEGPVLNFLSVFDDNRLRVAYAYTVIECQEDQDAFFHVGSDDGVKVYVNGELAHEVYADRGCREHEDIFTALLKKGSNAFLAKVDQGGGGWALVVEVMDRDGHRDYLREQLQTTLGIAVSREGSLGESLTLSADPGIPVGDAMDGTEVFWQALDADGVVVADAVGSFEEPVQLELPAREGFCSIAMRIPELRAEAQTACLLAMDREAAVGRILRKARGIADRPGNEAYAGWIAYRLFLTEQALARNGADSGQCAAEARQLADWLSRIRRDPLPEMRGGIEWAYLSTADRTGQPFSLFIPDDYDPAKSWPLRVNLHGMSGTHSTWVTLGQGHPADYFELHVMGRARGGGYAALCELDVLEAIAYVRAHWNIDPNRIHLGGGSMGGGGTFYVGSRHPHLFASAFPQCGYGTHAPVTNMLHVPVFSVHSDDDPTVPVALSRLPVTALSASGGRAIQHETTGLGHEVWRWEEGFARARDWESRQVRPATVDHVRYTATDDLARRAYWAEVVEWGPTCKPATFEVHAGSDNGIYAELSNVGVLSLNLAAAPVDLHEPMAVAVNGKLIDTLAPPLPRTLYLTADGESFAVGREPRKEFETRPHFPGGAPTLFHGEPLMIVWGTQGSKETSEALKKEAEVAARSPWPDWFDEEDEYPMWKLLYGRIPAKADVDVTRRDMEGNNLLLLGTAEQNSVVARIAAQLPVSIADGQVRTSDGSSYPFEGCALGLLYYNPKAPSRLVYWVASSNPADAAVGRSAVNRAGRGPAACDFVLSSAKPDLLVAQRSFRPDWSWEGGYGRSALLSADECTGEAMEMLEARALLAATNADYALVGGYGEAGPRYAAGRTRWADVTAQPAELPTAICILSPEEMRQLAAAVARGQRSERGSAQRLVPPATPADVPGNRNVRVVLPSAGNVSAVHRLLGHGPTGLEPAPVSLRDALELHVARM